MDSSISKKHHYALVNLMRKRGQWHRKKHGEWITLGVLGKILLLDTWNYQILVCDSVEPSGKDIYGGIVTFNPTNSYSIAIDFGGCQYNQPMLQFWNTHAKMGL